MKLGIMLSYKELFKLCVLNIKNQPKPGNLSDTHSKELNKNDVNGMMVRSRSVGRRVVEMETIPTKATLKPRQRKKRANLANGK